MEKSCLAPVCTAMIRTHRCGLDRDSRAKLAALFIQIFTGIQTASNEYDVACCSHLSRRYRPLMVSFAQNVRMSLRFRIRISWPNAHAGLTAHTS
jgi:hypothetical protein